MKKNLNQKGIDRLTIITKLNEKEKKYVNKDIYRLLYKEEIFVAAYEKIKSKQSNYKLDEFSIKKISQIIKEMKESSYQFKPSERIYIPKAGKEELRPIDIGDVKDKVVLEAIRMILEAIFESSFTETSHGFRSNKSCHTALRDIKVMCRGSKWFIEGDIKNYFNSIDQDILVSLIERRIEDKKFIDLIRKVLKAGYLEFKIRKTDLIGVPQGNIISPILSNIYLHELDVFMGELYEQYNNGKKRKPIKEYGVANAKVSYLLEKGKKEEAMELKKKVMKMIPYDYNDPSYSRLNYVRYADDWLVGMVSSKKKAIEVKEKIKVFLKEKLKLELNEEKTLITNAALEKVKFLGTKIYCPLYEEEKYIRRERNGRAYLQRKSSANIRMDMDVEKVLKKLKSGYFCDGGGNSMPKFVWLPYTHKEIIMSYNAVINGIRNYYSFIDNTISMARIYNILRSSAAKLLATKFKMDTQRKVFRKFGKGLKSPEGKSLILISEWKKKKMGFKTADELTNINELYSNRITRSNLSKDCILCGSTQKVEMHHIKHIRKMNKKLTPQEKSMVSLNRKQIPVCRVCHMEIHKGKYDGVSLKEVISKNNRS